MVWGVNMSIEEKLMDQYIGLCGAAATECLSIKIHTKCALRILKEISKKGSRMSAMASKRTLLIWNRKINLNDPF